MHSASYRSGENAAMGALDTGAYAVQLAAGVRLSTAPARRLSPRRSGDANMTSDDVEVILAERFDANSGLVRRRWVRSSALIQMPDWLPI